MTRIQEYNQAKEFKKILKTTGKYIQILAENGITNTEELLLYFPRAYEDRRNLKMISQLDPHDETVQTIK